MGDAKVFQAVNGLMKHGPHVLCGAQALELDSDSVRF